MEPIANFDRIPSPALILFPELIEKNIETMLEIVGGRPELLRPHVKTHKLGEILQLQKKKGIDKVKCATVAEMEMSAQAGVSDVLLAYQPVGPNMARILALREKFPDTQFSAVTDDLATLEKNAAIIANSGQAAFTFLIEFDSGMHRTGIEPGEAAIELAKAIVANPDTEFGGVHAYDGHIHEPDLEERKNAFDASLAKTTGFLACLKEAGIDAPKVVAGGSPTFAMHAEFSKRNEGPLWECSPGTPLLWDAGYGTNHPDLPFEQAAKLLTRVISKPGGNHLCLDLGNKSVAPENPIANRVRFPYIPDAKFIAQSEEHLVIATAKSDDWQVGDALLGIPWHICPSLALHAEAVLVRNGEVQETRWTIHARNRRLSV